VVTNQVDLAAQPPEDEPEQVARVAVRGSTARLTCHAAPASSRSGNSRVRGRAWDGRTGQVIERRRAVVVTT
jgi:hypothetical protein